MQFTASNLILTATPSGVDWQAERDRVDLAAIMNRYLGPAPGRRGNRGRLWWKCPFHPDRNPSLSVKENRWHCFGCGVSGDAVDFVKRMELCDFPEAVAILTGRTRPERRRRVGLKRPASGVSGFRPDPANTPPLTDPTPTPSGVDPETAAALVERSAPTLWTREAEPELDRLRARGLSDETIRTARLGWTGPVEIPKRDGKGTYQALGVVIPWFGRDGRPALVKIRQPDGRRPKYAEAFRDPARLLCYPGPEAIRPGRPAILAEGELDALCLASLLSDLDVSVLTLGSASGPSPARLAGPPADRFPVVCRPRRGPRRGPGGRILARGGSRPTARGVQRLVRSLSGGPPGPATSLVSGPGPSRRLDSRRSPEGPLACHVGRPARPRGTGSHSGRDHTLTA